MSTHAAASVPCDVKDLTLATQGKRGIDWAFQSMPVLQAIRKQFIKEQPFEGVTVGACLPVNPATAALAITLRDGGARVVLCGAGPAAVQDDVAACLVRDYLISVFAVSGDAPHPAEAHLQAALDAGPRIVLDHGAALTALAYQSAGTEIAGGVEETSAGIARLVGLAGEASLPYPVISIHRASVRRLIDSRYGTGQSTLDLVVQASGALVAGLTVVVAGYGAAGRGIASRARGLGANVIVTETDPIAALDAALDGYRVMAMQEAARLGDILITTTGNRTVIGREHFDRLKDGAFLLNAGASPAEIDVEALGKAASSRRDVKERIEEFKMKDGRRILLFGGGRSIRYSAYGPLPAAVVDVVLGAEALAAEHLLTKAPDMARAVHPLPASIDKQTAGIKLSAMGIHIDKLTVEQEAYLSALSEGN